MLSRANGYCTKLTSTHRDQIERPFSATPPRLHAEFPTPDREDTAAAPVNGRRIAYSGLSES